MPWERRYSLKLDHIAWRPEAWWKYLMIFDPPLLIIYLDKAVTGWNADLESCDLS